MTRYRYRAYDAQGQHYEDVVEGHTVHELTQALEARGYTVSSIEKVKQGGGFPGYRRLRWEDLRLFTEQLEAILRSGYPLVPALAALAADLHRPTLRHATTQLQEDLERGLSLEEAFRAQEHRFPPIFGALIRAGEVTGNLSGVLELMSGHAARMASMSHRIKTAMAYPAALCIGSTLVILHILLYTVPVFRDVFAETGGPIPAPTRFLLFISEILQHYWPVIIPGTMVVALCASVAFVALQRTQEGRVFLNACMLRFPAAGAAYHGTVQARFCRTLSLLLSARVPMLDALSLAGAASGSAVLEKGLVQASHIISQGGRLVEALQSTRFFSPSFYWLLGTAEARDQVEDGLENLADAADRSVRARERMIGSYITPLVTVAAGAIIGFIVVAMYLPIFTLGDQIGGN